MVQEWAKIRLIDAMNESYNRVDKMLDDNVPDAPLKHELEVFSEMEKTAKKYHIPYKLPRQRQR